MARQRARSDRPEAREETLQVRLFGGLEMRLGDEVLPPLGSARAETLLAYLLLHRDAPQQRRHLAFTLWPDSTEPQARTNLRHVLHKLRRGLPDADRLLEITPRTLRWRPEAPLSLDVAEFEQAIAQNRLEEAVHAYTGDLLEGSYDEWLLEERERLRQLHADALERLAGEREQQGRWPEAISYAERLLRHDPLREDAYRLLMRLHESAGDRARALRTYHACATTLVRELGVEPSATTRREYEALLEVAPGGEFRPAPPTALAGPPLVGRRAERARLAGAWRDAETGRAQLVLVSGEAGIGKSRLVEELRSWCARAGATTAEARAYQAEGAMAYGALVGWLRSEPIAVRLNRLRRADLIEIARLLPDLLAELPDLPRPEPVPADEQRQRLFAAAAEAIRSAGSPLLLVAEDLQWWDIHSLQFAHYLLRSAPEASLLVAATARREEIDPGSPADELLTALAALGLVGEVELDRLDREETGALAERVAEGPLSSAEADRLHEESEGNPLFLIEALRAQVEAGAPSQGEIGDRVQAVIGSRLARLSEPAAELVGLAATIGREFTAPLLADASEASEGVLVRSLDELWRGGLVRARGPTAYDFSHAKIREAAYRALSPAKARHHHLRVVEALQQAHPADPEAVSSRVAAHLEAAGSVAEAITWHARAAQAAQRVYASADAVRSLERAVRLARRLPEGEPRDRLELDLLTQLPAPLVAVEGYLSDRVAEVHERALALAGDLQVEAEPPLYRSLALATLTRGEFERARPFGERLRGRAERDGDEVLWVESAYVLGVSEYWRGRLEQARAEFEAALGRYRPAHGPEHLLRYGQDPQVFCRMRLAHTLLLLGSEPEAERARDEALAAAERIGHPYSRAGALLFATILALDRGDEEGLRVHVQELESDPALNEARPTRSGVQAFAAYLDLLDGRTGGGLERVRAELREARAGRASAPGHVGFLARLWVEALGRADEPRAGLAGADEALRMGGGTELWEAEIRRQRAGFLFALDADAEEIEAELARAIEVARIQHARWFERRARTALEQRRSGTR